MCCMVAFWGVILTMGHFNLSWSPLENGGQLAAVQYEVNVPATEAMMANVGQAAKTAMQATGQWLNESGVIEAAMNEGSRTLANMAKQSLAEGATLAAPENTAPLAANPAMGNISAPPMPDDALLS